jgi:hypothetical protein
MSATLPSLGARCLNVATATHVDRYGVETLGAVEFRWSDGAVTLIEVESDWTLGVTSEAWTDPFMDVDTQDPGWPMGRWERSQVQPNEPLGPVLDAQLVAVRQSTSAYGERQGINFDFGAFRLSATSWGGELKLELQR